jgi:DNA-binding IclR family transcriptional regulator
MSNENIHLTPREDESVVAIQRAVGILDAFGPEDSHLRLAELVRRARIPKTSALRIARTLESCGYLVRTKTGTWRLGPAAAWLGARYQVAFDLDNTIEPALQQVARATKETAAFFVHEGNVRNCLMRVKGTHGISARARIGQPMPLDRGSPGQVILAFTGKEGALYDEIRRRGFHYTIAEYSPTTAGVSAPVFGTTWSVVGALCVSGPPERLTEEVLLKHAPTVVSAARRLSYELSQGPSSHRVMAKSHWKA